MEKYDRIGINYNETRKADPYLASRMFQLLEAQKGETCLDIGAGTGNYTMALQQMGLNMIGVEPSDEMLDKARSVSNAVQWKKGKAEDIPLENESVSFVVASLTLHHWSSLKDGFRELSRVLQPGGKIVVFTSTPEQTSTYWLRFYFPKMIQDSAEQLPSFEAIETAMQANGIRIQKTEKYFVRDDLKDLFLYSGKNHPQYYFDTNIRRGISSFSDIARREEIENGLSRMKSDFESGEIDHYIQKGQNELGDYLFIQAEKQ